MRHMCAEWPGNKLAKLSKGHIAHGVKRRNPVLGNGRSPPAIAEVRTIFKKSLSASVWRPANPDRQGGRSPAAMYLPGDCCGKGRGEGARQPERRLISKRIVVTSRPETCQATPLSGRTKRNLAAEPSSYCTCTTGQRSYAFSS